jgi:hypothetical protein
LASSSRSIAAGQEQNFGTLSESEEVNRYFRQASVSLASRVSEQARALMEAFMPHRCRHRPWPGSRCCCGTAPQYHRAHWPELVAFFVVNLRLAFQEYRLIWSAIQIFKPSATGRTFRSSSSERKCQCTSAGPRHLNWLFGRLKSGFQHHLFRWAGLEKRFGQKWHSRAHTRSGTAAPRFFQDIFRLYPAGSVDDGLHERWVGAPEAVDALLGVAHPNGVLRQLAQAQENVQLNGRSVLKFIHEQQTNFLAQGFTALTVGLRSSRLT